MKLLLYKLSTTSFGRATLKLLSFGVSIPYAPSKKQTRNLSKKYTKDFKPFHVIITIDTEGGYVEQSERRVWQKESPTAYLGYHGGIRNIRTVLQKHGIKATFFLNTHCFSAKDEDYKKILSELRSLIKEGHEIGLHPHPDSDYALQTRMKKRFPATSCFFYDEKELTSILSESKTLIGEHIGNNAEKNLRSIRWGNWALNTDGVRAISKNKLLNDSSATPGIKGHLDDNRKYDWSNVNTNGPWNLSLKDYQSIAETRSPIKEIPISTFSFFGIKLRADPLYSELLKAAFVRYYSTMDRSKAPFPFVVMTHSCEMTTHDGRPTQALRDLDDFLSFVHKFDDAMFSAISNF